MIAIHATNISGTGANGLCRALFKSIEKLIDNSQICFYFRSNSNGFELAKCLSEKTNTIFVRSILSNNLNRFLECVITTRKYDSYNAILVMGDIPLRTRTKQIVYVHQPHLISPEVNSDVSKSFKFKVLRTIFACNIKYASTIIVQTESIKEQLLRSYPLLSGKVSVVGVPPPNIYINNFSSRFSNRNSDKDGISLFYPASLYKHKNHSLLTLLNSNHFDSLQVDKIYLTIDPLHKKYYDEKHILCLGYLTESECFDYYKKSDALLFLSSAESYGIPLVEAMYIGLHIICPDLDYARSLCGDGAEYFDINSIESLLQAIRNVTIKVKNGINPNWDKQLNAIPKNWDDVLIDILRVSKLDLLT